MWCGTLLVRVDAKWLDHTYSVLSRVCVQRESLEEMYGSQRLRVVLSPESPLLPVRLPVIRDSPKCSRNA